MESEADALWTDQLAVSHRIARRRRRKTLVVPSWARRGRAPVAGPREEAGKTPYGAAVGKVTEPLVFSGRMAAMKALNCSAFVTLPW